MYDTTAIGETVASVKLTGELNGAEIAGIFYNTSNAYTLKCVYDEEEGYRLDVILKEPASIKANSKVSFTVKIDWEGDLGTSKDNVKGLKSTTVKLTVQDASNAVKVK